MFFEFHHVKISGILTIVPTNRISIFDEYESIGFSLKKAKELNQIIGLGERRVVKNDICTSDMCVFGINYLSSKNLVDIKKEIDSIILVTQSPDHFMPPTSSILHGKLELSEDIYCIDINQGCTGYIHGLIQACMLLQQSNFKKVMLLNGDTLSRKTCPKDSHLYPLIGDAASITILEKSTEARPIYGILKNDGKRSDYLMIPAGGFRLPSSNETRKMVLCEDGNRRSKDDLSMNGAGIFLFTQNEIPKIILELLKKTETMLDNVDYFILHQTNRFILSKIAKKLNVNCARMPNNVAEIFGNSSSASIPTAICLNIGDLIKKNLYKICLSGFGVGLSWGALLGDFGYLKFADIIEM